ncbi:hypothetical protein ACLKA6_016260 [Drosophila palustris]
MATPVRAAQKNASVVGQQEALDERLSTSAVAAAARMPTSSEPTAPLVSEFRARQADPIDPLEDLAEDKDLADLKLDPAMAAEIEEPCRSRKSRMNWKHRTSP